MGCWSAGFLYRERGEDRFAEDLKHERVVDVVCTASSRPVCQRKSHSGINENIRIATLGFGDNIAEEREQW